MSEPNRVDGMKIGVCGLFCEKCPKLARGECSGCGPNDVCEMPGCAQVKGLKLCFECEDFPCEKCEVLFQKKWLEFAGSNKVVG